MVVGQRRPGHLATTLWWPTTKLKAFDASRPVQYERNNDIVDMGSNQYPSIGWMQGRRKGKYNIKYPFHISEYAHAMGNACGNLVDYWKAIESTNFFCGAASGNGSTKAYGTTTRKPATASLPTEVTSAICQTADSLSLRALLMPTSLLSPTTTR